MYFESNSNGLLFVCVNVVYGIYYGIYYGTYYGIYYAPPNYTANQPAEQIRTVACIILDL